MTDRPPVWARRLALAAFIVVAIAITGLSLTPVPVHSGPPGSDKLHHFVAYGALIFPIALTGPRSLAWALPLSVLLGAGIEALQPLVGRAGELADLAANIAGLVLGLALGRLFARVWPGARART